MKSQSLVSPLKSLGKHYDRELQKLAGSRKFGSKEQHPGWVSTCGSTLWIGSQLCLVASTGINVHASYSLCSSHSETRNHLLLSCDYIIDVWHLVLYRFHGLQVMFLLWSELLFLNSTLNKSIFFDPSQNSCSY